MVFKLVRTDADDPCKIQLRVGKYLLGRGKFLDCDDKRISRNHGELEVMEDTVIVKALHQNPCFIIRKESDETQILTQNCTSNISHGDRFGLLPHTYWYELLHCNIADVDKQPPATVSEGNDIDSVFTEPYEPDTAEEPQKNCDLNNTVANEKSPESPSLLSPEPHELPGESNAVIGTGDESGKNSPNKRSLSSDGNEDSCVIKKVKIEDEENVEIKKEPVDVQVSNNAAASASNDQPGSSNSNADNDAAKRPASPTKRERCMYGANCYRRNHEHKAQFSHPSDADWGLGDRGQCPWGAACRRRNPRHWRDNDHPPGVQPPPQNNAGKKTKRQINKYSGTDDDEENENIPPVLIKKRVRKFITIQHDWDDSDSLGEEDPYRTDDEDSEWLPLTNTDDTID